MWFCKVVVGAGPRLTEVPCATIDLSPNNFYSMKRVDKREWHTHKQFIPKTHVQLFIPRPHAYQSLVCNKP